MIDCHKGRRINVSSVVLEELCCCIDESVAAFEFLQASSDSHDKRTLTELAILLITVVQHAFGLSNFDCQLLQNIVSIDSVPKYHEEDMCCVPYLVKVCLNARGQLVTLESLGS